MMNGWDGMEWSKKVKSNFEGKKKSFEKKNIYTKLSAHIPFTLLKLQRGPLSIAEVRAKKGRKNEEHPCSFEI